MNVGDKVRFISTPHYGEYTITEKLYHTDPRVIFPDKGQHYLIKRPGEERVVPGSVIKRTCGWNRMG